MNERSRTILIAALTALIVALASIFLLTPQGSQSEASGETVFERVNRTGILRCGYYIIEPNFIRDPNTGEFSGIIYDLIVEAGRIVDWKVEFVEEVSVANAVEGLVTNRYDAICTSLYRRPNIFKQVDFAGPHYYVPVKVYQRIGDTRFQNGIADLHAQGVTISTVDGSIADIIARDQFPDTKRVSLPEMSPYSDMLLNVANGKADVAFVEPAVAGDFIAKNPGKLEAVGSIPHLRIFPNIIGVRKGEYDLANTLDNAIDFLVENGFVDQLLDKYERHPGSYIRVRPGYQESN